MSHKGPYRLNCLILQTSPEEEVDHIFILLSTQNSTDRPQTLGFEGSLAVDPSV